LHSFPWCLFLPTVYIFFLFHSFYSSTA
jgi:hypothetical protein